MKRTSTATNSTSEDKVVYSSSHRGDSSRAAKATTQLQGSLPDSSTLRIHSSFSSKICLFVYLEIGGSHFIVLADLELSQ